MGPDSIYSSPTTSDNLNRRNILIVGDVGVGKSSLVNLIAGRELATTSSGPIICTSHVEEYIVTLDGVEFTLHDTIVERSGGISLLVFCMKAGRVSVQPTYNLFVEVFCNRQVPVVIVVTHLEMYDCMEQWWNKNESVIEKYGLRSHGHACVTTTRGYKKIFSDKYEQSKEIIQKLILVYSDRVAWKELSPRLVKQLDGSDLRRILTTRCGFSVEDAGLLAQKMEGDVWRRSKGR